MPKAKVTRVLNDWVAAAQEFTSGKKRFVDFIMATIDAANQLCMHGVKIPETQLDLIKQGFEMAAIQASYFLPCGSVSFEKGAVKMTPEAAEAVEYSLLCHKAFRNQDPIYRWEFADFARNILLKMVIAHDLPRSTALPQTIGRSIQTCHVHAYKKRYAAIKNLAAE